jgi:DNA-binding Lrp family transcriptional regulator
MTDLDDRLVDALTADGRASVSALADAVGVSRSTVAGRLDRLLDSGRISIHGVVHPAVLGRGVCAYVQMAVAGAAAPIARAVAAHPDVTLVSLISGGWAISVELRVASHGEVEVAVGELRAIASVQQVRTLIYTALLRDVVGPVGEVRGTADDIDRSLLRGLERDGRASYADLATATGISAAAARRRVLRLLDDGVVRVGAVTHQTEVDRTRVHGAALHFSGAAPDLDALTTGIPELSFAARTLGWCDALITLRASTSSAVAAALDVLRAQPEVRAVESWSHLHVVKETYVGR